MLLDAPDEKMANEIFNVGYQNISIMEIAHLVKRVVQEEFPEKGEIGIVTTPATTSAPTTSIRTKSLACSASRQGAPSRKPCAICAGPSKTAGFPIRWG